jgi:DNA invertase Pin-like site-specific DNA recombinase
VLRIRTREGMAVARAKRQARGRQPKLSPKQQAELCRMYASSDYASANLAELFTVSPPTMYRTLQRSQAPRHGDAMPAPSLISHIRPFSASTSATPGVLHG